MTATNPPLDDDVDDDPAIREDGEERDPRWSTAGVSFDRHYSRRNYYEEES